MRFLVLNGPNLNLLNKRVATHYGGLSLEEIERQVLEAFPGVEIVFRQSNHEGEHVDWVQGAEGEGFDGLLANFGGYSHTSVAIHDALELCNLPKVEVHLSNLHAREPFRHESLTARRMAGVIAGFGPLGYRLGVQALLELAAAKGS